jgi:hypothetical protein
MFETFLTHLTGLLQPIAQYLAPIDFICCIDLKLVGTHDIDPKIWVEHGPILYVNYSHKAGKLVILLVHTS